METIKAHLRDPYLRSHCPASAIHMIQSEQQRPVPSIATFASGGDSRQHSISEPFEGLWVSYARRNRPKRTGFDLRCTCWCYITSGRCGHLPGTVNASGHNPPKGRNKTW